MLSTDDISSAFRHDTKDGKSKHNRGIEKEQLLRITYSSLPRWKKADSAMPVFSTKRDRNRLANSNRQNQETERD